jgi:DNA-binding transcriptional MocR family regulator
MTILTDGLSPDLLADRLADRSKRGIARTVCELIRHGEIAVGAVLPPVRDLASRLGVSPATVSAAWSELRRLGLVEGRGRSGLRVAAHRGGPHPSRFSGAGYFRAGVRDLTLAVPDPALLPPLGEALAAAAAVVGLNQYARVRIIDRLAAAVRRDWPYDPPALVAVDGGYDGVRLALAAEVLPGARIAVEMPTAMRLLDIIDAAGLGVIPVACDDEGPRPDSLAAAMAAKPAMFLFQPRTHSVTGHTVSAARLAALAEVLAPHDLPIVEDDGIGALSAVPPQSLGRWFPGRVVHVRSYAKSHGPDLRLAVVSASTDAVERIQGLRAFGAGWTSRLLQETLAHLLDDPAAEATVVRARGVYAARRAALFGGLAARGIVPPVSDGLCAWLPVGDESFALVTFAAHNIAVSPGSRFAPPPMVPHVRIATSLLADRVDEVAEVAALVHAASGIERRPR